MRALNLVLLLALLNAAACGAMGDDPVILNLSNDSGGEIASADVPAKLRRSANRLVAEFVNGKRVDYDGLAASDAFKEYLALARSLDRFDPTTLETREEKLAFWINLYNAVVMHSVLESGIEGSVREQMRFFDRYAYRIGGLTYTPNQIEHGILRGERMKPDDPRAKHVVEPLDPRAHFALNCASVGCPPIGAYNASQIDDQLDLATASFLNSPSEVSVDEPNHTVHLTPLFDWYKTDFGDVFDFILAHLDDGPTRDYLAKHRDTIIVRYNDYDWSLNH